MIRVGLIGIGPMGRAHLKCYLQLMQEKTDIQLVALCDVNPEQFKACDLKLDLGYQVDDLSDFSRFRCYTDVDEMLEKETALDMVDIVTPTYLHCELACKCLAHGLHVFAEKPMGRNPEECERMLTAAKEADRNLMIGFCLRFSSAYRYLKELIDSRKYGKVISAQFSRASSTPIGGYHDWYRKQALGGGAIFDQHIHDADMVSFLFGMPEAVSSSGVRKYEGSGYDAVSTIYYYPDEKIVTSHNDWCEHSRFHAEFRVNFENAMVVYENRKLSLNVEGDREYRTVLESDGSEFYRNEILYFTDCLREHKPITFNSPEDSRNTIRLVEAEVRSCELRGEKIRP